jgi:hypothetical protein
MFNDDDLSPSKGDGGAECDRKDKAKATTAALKAKQNALLLRNNTFLHSDTSHKADWVIKRPPIILCVPKREIILRLIKKGTMLKAETDLEF